MNVSALSPKAEQSDGKPVKSLYANMERWRPYVLSILRIVVALLFLEHGLSKVFGFPTPGPQHLHGLIILAAFLETVGSALLLLGVYKELWRSSSPARWRSPISWRTRRAGSFPS